ncbi:MAG: ATP-binding protein [Acidobacteria bacterium]|nr:ATP-binding protein [Acidobacteriota bacterium]
MRKVDHALRGIFDAYFREKCPHCGGTSWVVEENVARRCECFTRDLDHNRKAFAGIPPAMMNCTLQNFYPQNDVQMEALTTVGRYVRNYEETFGSGAGMLLRGPVGTGKTHLAVAVLKALIEKGFTGVFLNFVHLIEQIKMSFDADADPSVPDMTRRLRHCHVVVMDELGAVNPTPFVFDKLYDVINQCLANNVSLVFTTNFFDEVSPHRPKSPHRSDFENPDELARPSLQAGRTAGRFHTLSERINDRLHSRILEKCADITLEGPDYRRLKRQGPPKSSPRAQ